MEKPEQQMLQEYNNIEKDIENVQKVSEYVSLNFELYGEPLDDIEALKEYRKRFKKTRDFRNKYEIEFNKLNESIKEIYSNWDDVALWSDKVLGLKEQARQELCNLDNALVQWYKKGSISPFVEKDDLDGLTVTLGYKVKDIPTEIIYETLENCKKEQAFLPNMRELTDEEDMEYCYFLYCFALAEEKEQKAIEIQGFIDKIFDNMLEHGHFRNYIYGEYNLELVDKENKKSGKKQCSFQNFNPRQWQIEAYELWNQKNQDHHGTFSVATGAGKTLFALYCLQQELEKDNDILTIIITPTKAIMQNWYESLIEKFHVHKEVIGRRGGGHGKCLWNTKKFIIYISNTAQKELADYTVAFEKMNELKNRDIYQFYICDECHRYATENNLKMFDGLKYLKTKQEDDIDYYSVGLSATPERGDGREVYFYRAIGDVIYKYNILEALADNAVSPFTIKNVYCKLTKKERKKLKELNQKIFSLIKQLNALTKTVKTKLFTNTGNLDTETIIREAYIIIASNKKVIDKINTKKEGFKKKHGKFAEGALNDWLNKQQNSDMKIIYLCNALVSGINKRKLLIMNSHHRNKKCLKLVRKNINKKIIIFSEFIESAEAIYEELVLQYGGKKIRRYYSLNPKQRQNQTEAQREKENMEALTSFKNGEANVIVTVKAFDEGVDVPDADVGIIYQSTKGTRQAIQRLGRVVRKAQDGDEEKNPMLYYLYHPEYQAEFLKGFFENPYKLYRKAFDDDSEDDVVNNTTEDNEELIKGRGSYEQAVCKYKAGLDKIVFIPKNKYDFSKYDIKNDNNDTI